MTTTTEPNHRDVSGLLGLGGKRGRVRRHRLHRGDDGAWTAEALTTDPAAAREQTRRPGRWLIWASVALLGALAGVAFYVSYAAQFGFVWAIKHLMAPAAAEALIPDAGMLICAMLALAMAVQGRSAKTARTAVIGFAALSAWMNYEAANSTSVHAVTVYVMPAVAFAVCTDLVVSVLRRFYYGLEDQSSPWATLGRALARMARGLALVALYLLRFCLDRRETFRGVRQAVLNAAPLPRDPGDEPEPEVYATKKAALLAAYAQHPARGDRKQVSRVAAELAEAAGLSPGTARSYLYAHLAKAAP
jgi:uncharacterized protein DUF2637